MSFLQKRFCCGAAAVEKGNFFENQPHTHSKNPDEIQKIKIDSKMKNEAQSHKRKHSKNCDRFIAEAEDKLTNGLVLQCFPAFPEKNFQIF